MKTKKKVKKPEPKKIFLGLKDPSINYEGIHKKLW